VLSVSPAVRIFVGIEPTAVGCCVGGYRRPRDEPIERVFDIVCGCCGSKMHHSSHIEDPQTIARISGHLGLATEPPRKG
jgi:hypothetical protein